MNWSRILAAGFGAYVYDVHIRRWLAVQEAEAYCRSVGKPMINVGCGANGSALFGSTTFADVNVDIAAPVKNRRLAQGTVGYGDAHDLSRWPDKYFGALIASHILEHLTDPDRALNEWSRVSDRQWILVPRWWDPACWLHPGHKWYFSDGNPLGPKWRLY